jgi:two-component system sensor histidine kinase DctS
VLRVETWTRAPYWLANTATALVLALAIALAAVLWLLFRDTRKRLRAEESLRQSQERLQRVARLANLGEMASMLSHELNQPLAAIASYAVGGLNVLAMPAPDLADIQTALERIAGQSERAGKVIKSVNEFVRSRETERVAIAPQALLDSVFPLLRLQAQQLHARLSIRVESALPTVWCDKTLIEQVVINLVRNGLQAMQDLPVGAPRELTLRIQRSGPRLVEFDVADTGPGLASEVAAQLFTPFFTTKNDGIGLGLSLCRTVVEQHGGSLSYTTQQGTASTGTTFQFRLMTYEAAHRLPHHTEDPTTIDRH